jgi:hypothetical protein
MKLLNKIAVGAIALGTAGTANAQFVGADCGCPPLASRTEINVSTLLDAQGNFTADQDWDCSNTYILDQNGPAYVGPGRVLNIGAGTVIKGSIGSGLDASSLVVSRDGKIFATGTQDCKIVFTSVNDVNVDGSYDVSNTAQWGSLIVLGRAKNNLVSSNGLGVADGLGRIEGLVGTDPRNWYGADLNGSEGPAEQFDNHDNSGVIRHVSLRYGGTVIGANNEINGLTCGSVGDGTVIENVEIVANEDDGIELFGGTVNVRYASLLFNQDDYVDIDHGYEGNVQYVFALQSDVTTAGGRLGDHILELDGEDDNIVAGDQGFARIFNVTGISNTGGDPAVELKEDFAGVVANSIFVGSPLAGLRFSANAEENFLVTENLLVYNNSFDAIASGDLTIPGTTLAQVQANQNIFEAGVLPDAVFDITNLSDVVVPIPAAGTAGNASGNVFPGIDPVQYRGAFAPGEQPWINGGFLDQIGGIGNLPNGCRSDLNGDGLINSSDFSLFGADFAAGSCN